MSDKAGGFLTGWKGWVILVTGLATAGVIAWTGYAGSQNTFPRLASANSEFVNPRTSDFGANLFLECITNNTRYPYGGAWQFQILPDKQWLNLTDSRSVFENLGVLLSAENRTVEEAFITTTRTVPPFTGYRYRPEDACLAACVNQLGDDCTTFTYDGLTADSCRFLAPGQTMPPPEIVDFAEDPHFYTYNATCMVGIRDAILAGFLQPATGLLRPNVPPAPATSHPFPYWNAVRSSYLFYKTQWAGRLPVGYEDDVPWREAGFFELDEDTCPGDLSGGSFFAGHHAQVTMASAEATGILALGRLWWNNAFVAAPAADRAAALEHILREATWLAKTYNAADGSVLVGIGTEFNETTNELLMYQDFGSAGFALQVGPPPEDNEFGQPTPVNPKCEFSTAEVPAADVSAHAAAALALASQVSRLYDSNRDGPAWLRTAASLYAASKRAAPIDAPNGSNRGVDSEVDGRFALGASTLYSASDVRNVYAHQMWAACTLWQATNNMTYWRDVQNLYPLLELERGAARVYWPVPNYDNPAWYGMMCIAQSAPTYSGFEANITTPVEIGAGDLNNTNFQGMSQEAFDALPPGDRALALSEVLLERQVQPGSRRHALDFIWRQLITRWIVYDNDPISLTSGGFRYANITDSTNKGMFRETSNTAMLALMFADMPGLTNERRQLARCMARQSIDYILGNNPNEYSYQVGFGTEFPQNPFHKDAACPPAEVRVTQFEQIFDRVADTGQTSDLTFATRKCDSVTFQQPNLDGVILDNSFELTGALVSNMDPTDESYLDVRELPPAEEGGIPGDNVMSAVAIDYNSGFTNALAGLVALPQEFWAAGCPTPAAMQAQLFTEVRQRAIEDNLPVPEIPVAPAGAASAGASPAGAAPAGAAAA